MAYGDCYTPNPTACSGRALPGVTLLQSRILSRWPRLANLGIYACRPNSGGSGLSKHAAGEAGDTGVRPEHKADGDALAAWLVAVAPLIGCQRVIWYRRDWDNIAKAWTPYGGTSPHTDHCHWELCHDAALTLTASVVDPLLTLGPRKVPDMLLARWQDSPGVVLVFAAKNWAPVEDGTDYEAMVRAGIPSIVVQTAATWRALTGTPPPG